MSINIWIDSLTNILTGFTKKFFSIFNATVAWNLWHLELCHLRRNHNLEFIDFFYLLDPFVLPLKSISEKPVFYRP